MQRRIGFVIAWVAITGVSVFIATQAVGAVRDSVTDSPAGLATVGSVAAALDTTLAPTTTVAPVTDPPTTSAATSTTEADPSTTTFTAPVTPSTAAPPPTTATPTSAAPTTTAAPPTMETATYQLVGGWVRIRYGDGQVRLVDAAPYAGFSMQPKESGPEKVEIEFDGDDYEGKFKADMEHGTLDVEIDESGDED